MNDKPFVICNVYLEIRVNGLDIILKPWRRYKS